MSARQKRELRSLRRHAARLHGLLVDGSYWRLPARTRRRLLVRVRDLYEGLRRCVPEAALRGALAASVVALLACSAGCDDDRRPAGDAPGDTIADVDDDEHSSDVPPDTELDPTHDDPDPDVVLDPDASDSVDVTEDDGGEDGPSFALPLRNPFGFTRPTYTGYASPAAADIDGDGDYDLFMATLGHGVAFWENTGTAASPAFARPEYDPFWIDAPRLSCGLDFADLDGDGDLDLVLGEYLGDFRYYENVGFPTAATFAAPLTNPIGLSATDRENYPRLLDLDDDRDQDLLTIEWGGAVILQWNTGTESSPTFAAPLVMPWGGVSRTVLSSTDLDFDGDFDMLLGGPYGDFAFFENVGTPSSLDIVPGYMNPYGLTPTSGSAAPTFADMDGDGDEDLLVVEDNPGYVDLLYYENTTL